MTEKEIIHEAVELLEQSLADNIMPMAADKLVSRAIGMLGTIDEIGAGLKEIGKT